MASPLPIVGFFALAGGLVALAVATSSARSPSNVGGGGGGGGGALPTPSDCAALLAAIPPDLAARIGSSTSFADLTAVASALDARGMKPAGDCLRAQINAGMLKATTGGGGPLGGTPIGAMPADCTFADIPDNVATPPGFPTPVMPGMDSLRTAARNSFLTLKSSSNGPGLVLLGQTLNTMGYSNSAACCMQWGTMFGGLPTGGGMTIAPGAKTPAATAIGGGGSLHDWFDAQIKGGGLGGAPATATAGPMPPAPPSSGAIAIPSPPPPPNGGSAMWNFEAFGLSPAMG